MQTTMTQTPLDELTKEYPPPQSDKADRRLHRLERMTNFYIDKAEVAPEKQATMFQGFVSALRYAMTTMKMYRKLTRRIKELAEEEDETRTNS